MLVGPTIRRRRLGAVLRRLRESRSLKLEYVAGRLGVAPSTLSRIETGKAPTRTSYLAIMLDLYGVDDPGQRMAYLEMAREGQRRGWWADAEDLLSAGFGTYLGLEAESAELRVFGATVVPGLLRTPDYARAVIGAARADLTPAQIDRLVAVQMRRQEVLRGADGARLRLVLDESVLLRVLGSAQVMRQQLERLAGAGAEPAVTVQVLRLSGGHRPAPSVSFGILSFTEPGDADVVCAEGIRGQVLLEEREGDVRAMHDVFDALSGAAMTPDDSAVLIGELAGRYEGPLSG